MAEENGLIPFSQDLEKLAEMTWQQFTDRSDRLRNKLMRMYDESPAERQEYGREVCWGGYNFGKTVGWVVDYSPHPKALESVASALESIVQWPNAGSMAWEMRRFIKFSAAHGYNNVTDVIEFGDFIKKIGYDDPTNENNFHISMDFLYWDSGWGVDGESSDEEILQVHLRNVRGVVKELERYAHPEIIDIEQEPTKEEIEARNREVKEQYKKDFLADAKSFYRQPSIFDHLKRDELIRRPYHKILTYPAEMQDIIESSACNDGEHTDASEAILAFYENQPYMVDKRNRHAFESHLRCVLIPFNDRFERRLKRTLKDKPWLIDFSVNNMDLFGKSFVGGNHGCNHAGEVELVFKNPNYDPMDGTIFNAEYGHRTLQPEEERLFFESVAKVESLAHIEPRIRPPKQSWVFNGQGGMPYKITLQDGRKFNMFLKKEYGSIYREGKIVLIAQEGPEPLFNYNDQQSNSSAK